MGTKNLPANATELSIFSWPPCPTALTSKNRAAPLLMQPLEEFLKASVGKYGFHRVERVPKLVVTPRLVDEILTRMTRGHDLASAFAPRHHVMSTRWDLPFTKDAR